MFLLGHSCWSYLFSKLTGRQLKVSLPAYLAFLSGVLPDFDIYFQNLTVNSQPLILHHTWTHSLLVVIPAVVLLCYFFGRLGMAFSAGILSHLVADSLVGTIPLVYPFYQGWLVGLDLGIPSLADTLLELGALALVIIYGFWNGDYRLLLRPSRDSLLLVVPLVAIVTLSVLFAGDNSIPLASLAFSRRALTAITAGHAVLGGILGLGLLQGVRWLAKNRMVGSPGGDRASAGPESSVG